MKISIALFSMLFASQSFAGGGTCSDCYAAYRCTDEARRFLITIEASYGIDFTGAIGWLDFYPAPPSTKGGEIYGLRKKRAYLSDTAFILKFAIVKSDGGPPADVFLRLLLPRENWNHVQKVKGFVSRNAVDTPVFCQGEGFDEGSEITPDVERRPAQKLQ